jgi:hypothetical protein
MLDSPGAAAAAELEAPPIVDDVHAKAVVDPSHADRDQPALRQRTQAVLHGILSTRVSSIIGGSSSECSAGGASISKASRCPMRMPCTFR